MPIAEVGNTCLDRQFTELQSTALTTGESVLVSGVAPSVQRLWMMPSLETWNGDLFNISGIGDAFCRDEFNAAYAEAVETAGTVAGGRLADRYVSKVQLYYIAAMERAFRARHASSVRCNYHAAGRRRGHGGEFSVFAAVKDYLLNTLASGYSGPAISAEA